ncbi:serine/threonine-protein kinase [Actinocorallia aurea]
MTHPLRPDDPDTVGPYRLTGRLGAGGMGTVYLGADDAGRSVAVKVINPGAAGDPQFRARFRHEVEAARLVRRFCTAPVLDAQVHDEPLYIVTEHVAGPTLEEAVVRGGPLRGADLEALAVGTATALAAVHDAGLVHRDLKPANVLLSALGPRVIDFGIARALDSGGGVTRAGQLVGTPSYMAPEIVRGGEPSPASDVFSWGCVIAFAGTGRGPFEGGTMPEILYRIAHDPPVLDGLDAALLPLVSRALAKDPGRRPTVGEILGSFTGAPAAGSEETLASAEAVPPLDVPPPDVPLAAEPLAAEPLPAEPPPAPAAAMRGSDGSPFIAVDEDGAPLIGPVPEPPTPPAPTVSPSRATTGAGGATGPDLPEEAATIPPDGIVVTRAGLRAGIVIGAIASLLVVPLLVGLAWLVADGAGAEGADPGPRRSSLLAVPEGFLGQWQGRVVRSGTKGVGRPVTVSLTEGGLGEKIGTSAYPGCTKDLTLTRADAVELLVLESGTGPGCAGAVSSLTLSLTDEGLVYGLEDGGAAAVGTLTR